MGGSNVLDGEARHMGMAMGLDTLKYTSIDIDIRAVTDYLVFKAQGIMGFPSDLHWLYGYLDPHYTRRMKKNQFYILSRAGSIGIGTFPEVKWYKQEREHIIKKLGIELEYREEIDYGEDKGSFKTLSDYKHGELVKDYIEGKGSMVEIGAAHGFSNATVHNHTKSHNRALETAGECPRCRRIGSEYSKTHAKRPKRISCARLELEMEY